jgi:molybdopterin molybdotransferase
MITVNEARSMIREFTSPAEVVSCSLFESHGMVTAKDIVAEYDIPAYAQSSMDGYALRHSDRNESLHIIGEMAAGSSKPMEIQNKQATRIFTGAPLPLQADTVIMQEKAIVEGSTLKVDDPALQKGMHVRTKGAEIKKGEVALPSGSFLTVAAIGFLAGIGIAEVPVYRRPAVSVILTGSELQSQGRPLEFGKVYDSNSLSLRLALKTCGITQVTIHNAIDDIEVVRTVLDTALMTSDVVLLTGGVSVGDYDFVTRAAELCGITTRFPKVKQRPGKPLYFGTKGTKLIFGLPGNPSSALTCFYIYVLPALDGMLQTQYACKTETASIMHDFTKAPGLTQFAKAQYRNGQVTILHAQESFRLRSFAQSNALAELAEERDSYQAGEQIPVHLLPS